MKTEHNILLAFILNLLFSVIEFFGGLFTNSVSILSDSIHDLSDAISIGVSYFLEKKSKKKPDEIYTYGYLRFSILGAFITTTILIVGSIFMIIESVKRIFNPVILDYNGMIILSIFGIVINLIATIVTHKGDSLNQKSVNLHMLEDVFGWIIVLIGSILIKYLDITMIDSIMSIIVSLFIFINAFKNLIEITNLFLVKIPKNINIDELKKHLLKIDGVNDIHHMHIWSMDNINNYATIHVVTDKDNNLIKHKIREELKEHNINHVTIEIDDNNDSCEEKKCDILTSNNHYHHHH